MMKKEPFLQNFPNSFKIISLIVIIIICVFLLNLVGILIAIPIWGSEIIKTMTEGIRLDIKENISFYKFLQIFNHLGMFLIPSVLFAYFVKGNIGRYLKINRSPKIFTLISGILLIIVCLPLINWLVMINEMMTFPESLSYIEVWMRKSEENAMLFTNEFLNVNNIGGLIINLMMIAVIPAIGEEFMFRGVLQKLFKDWIGNAHIAIILSSFLFSAMHLQFFGFLPRFVLGMLLGYLFYFSRNLWIPIIAHFFNNGIAVLIYYLNNNKITNTDIDKLGSTKDDYILIIGSLIFIIVLMMSIYKREHSRIKRIIKKED
jgi:membrane protease YdiL (CAAX protease family)